jgi:hypothetical protein
VAHATEAQERFGDGILQFTVVRQQKHKWYLHARIFAHAGICASQQLRITAHFLRADFHGVHISTSLRYSLIFAAMVVRYGSKKCGGNDKCR